VAQALVGGTWTHASQLSVLMEAWWDGTAEGVSLSSSARRSNVFVRASWLSGAWQPGLDVLYTPADLGFSVTASLLWQGDRVQVQGGVRNYGGPADAVLAQLPGRSTAFAAVTWSF
jgi:hypothetical protein